MPKSRGGVVTQLSTFKGPVLLRSGLLIWHTANGGPIPRYAEIWPSQTMRLSLIGRPAAADGDRRPPIMIVSAIRYSPESGAITNASRTRYALIPRQQPGPGVLAFPAIKQNPGALAAAKAATRQLPGHSYRDPRPVFTPRVVAAFARPTGAAEVGRLGGKHLYPASAPGPVPGAEKIYLDMDGMTGIAYPNHGFDFLRSSGLIPPGTALDQYRNCAGCREVVLDRLANLPGAELRKLLNRYRASLARSVYLDDDDLLESFTQPKMPLVAHDYPRAAPLDAPRWSASDATWDVSIAFAPEHAPAIA